MAQYHYVIGYDTEKRKWFLESDTTAYFSDGNLWDDEQYRQNFYGWRVPEDGSDDEALDYDLLNTLYSIVDIIPVPKEHENATS
jgi:hypothetical protein